MGGLPPGAAQTGRPRNNRFLFAAGKGNALDKLALENEVQNQHGDHSEQAARHEHGVVGHKLALQGGQAGGQGHQVDVGVHHQRPHEVGIGKHGGDSNLLNNAVKYSEGNLYITLTKTGEIYFKNPTTKLTETQECTFYLYFLWRIEILHRTSVVCMILSLIISPSSSGK